MGWCGVGAVIRETIDFSEYPYLSLFSVSDSILVTFMPLSDETKCIELVALQDHVIEGEESLKVELSVATNLPAIMQSFTLVLQ